MSSIPNSTQLKTRFQYKVTEIKDNVAEMCYIIGIGHQRILLFCCYILHCYLEFYL